MDTPPPESLKQRLPHERPSAEELRMNNPNARPRLSPSTLRTLKRQSVKKATFPVPDGFKPLSSKLLLHESTGLLIEIVKRRITDPTTSYFLGRNNSIAIELYKSQPLPYYFITKGSFHPANWIYLQDADAVRDLAQVTDAAELKLCAECLLVCAEKRGKRHGCEADQYHNCKGFSGRADLTGLGHVIITELPSLTGAAAERLKELVDEQQKILHNPDDAIKERQMAWIASLKEDWMEMIGKRRSDALEKYYEKKGPDMIPTTRRLEQLAENQVKKHLKTESLGGCGVQTGSRSPTPTNVVRPTRLNLDHFSNMKVKLIVPTKQQTRITEIPEKDERTAEDKAATFKAMKALVTTAIDEMLNDVSEDDYESEVHSAIPDMERIMEEYMTDPIVSTTILPYILLDSITDELLDQSEKAFEKFRFKMEGKTTKLTVYDDLFQFPLSLQIENIGGERGWSAKISHQRHIGKGMPFAEISCIETASLSFPSLCQTLVMFRALICAVMVRIGHQLDLPKPIDGFMEHCFEWMPCSPDDSMRIAGKRLYLHVSRWK